MFAMPWNEAERAKYEVIRDRYSTELSDAEFELIAPLLDAPKKLGRKPTDFRVILNAVFCIVRVGCHWRLSPIGFPAVHDRSKQIFALGGTADYGRKSFRCS
jgi:hypothetical protein